MLPNLQIDLPENAFLRPLKVADVTPGYVDGLNDPVVHRYLVGPRRERQTDATVRQFVAANAADPAAILFGLYIGAQLRGTCRLHDIDPGKGCAHLGISLFDRSIWGQGWGSRVIRAVAEHAVAAYGLSRIVAGIEEDNQASRRSFTKAGFVSEDTTFEAHGALARRWHYRKMIAS